MNCCDEYGDCRQGRDCPVRCSHSKQDDEKEMVHETIFLFVILAFEAAMLLWILLK